MTNCKKALAYIALKDIERNGVSDCLEKESTPLVSRSLAPQARKLHSIDELFLAAKRGLRDFMKVAVKKTVVYKTLKVMAPLIGWRKRARHWLHAHLRRKRESCNP